MAIIKCSSLNEEVYSAFISEAIRRSDSIQIRIAWPNEKFWFADKTTLFKMGFSEENYENMYLKALQSHKDIITIFDNDCLPFVQKLEPYFAEGDMLSKKQFKYLLKPSQDIVPLLLEPKSILDWRFPKYPEDLTFISSGKCWFSCESHEAVAGLYANSEYDYEFWCKLGIEFEESFNYLRDVQQRKSLF